MKKTNLVKLLGVASCCVVMTVSVAKADAVALSETDLDRVTAGQLLDPIELPSEFQGKFDLLPGLLAPPPPPPPPPEPDPVVPDLRDLRGLPGQALSAILQLILSGGLR